MLARRGGGGQEASQSHIPKDTEAKSSRFHSNFLCNGAELPCWGTDYKPAGYVKRKQDFFPEREPSCCSKRTWQHSSVLTLHTELREAWVRGPGGSSKQSCLESPRPADQRRQGKARTGRGPDAQAPIPRACLASILPTATVVGLMICWLSSPR